jgi:predicted nucleic acid-binding protein
LKAVIDTNVIAYYLLRTEQIIEECTRFWHELEEPMAPALWEAELVNVLWLMTRKNVVTLSEALNLLDLAETLGIRSIAVGELWHGALRRSCTFGVSPYDALFVELAERESLPLATFDEGGIKAFPRVAMHPGKLTTS